MLKTTVFITNTTYYFIKRNRVVYCFVLLILCLTQQQAIGQSPKYEIPAFTLAQKVNNDVVLYQLNSTTNTWKIVGSTGRFYLKSIAIDSENEILYTVDGGKLGMLNPKTGKFSSIGEIGLGSGEIGNIKIDNVFALAYDANRNILYASHRMDDFDVLLQINPKTGKIIRESMINRKGKKADYKIVIIETFYLGVVYESKKIIDLAYNNEQKALYIVHNYFNALHGINSFVNIDEQKPKEDFKISPIKNLAGIAFDNEEKFFASFSNNQISTGSSPFGGGVTIDFGNLDSIDPNLNEDAFFFGLDFYKPPTSCSNSLQLNNTPIYNAPKSAISTIESSAIINKDVMFVAGKSISLNNNFEVTKSATFEAIIDSNVCK